MLINLSNHPSGMWDVEQMKAAEKKFGNIADLMHPEIPPDADEDFVTGLAAEYGKKIIEMLSDSKQDNNKYEKAVHLMGEQTFCFALLNYIGVDKVPFYASTTKRNVIESENGSKQSVFKFVRFRKYTCFKIE